MNFKITQNGKDLDKSKYTWDEETKTLSTKESNLVLDFSDINGVTFKTGNNCTFNTGSDCTFNTGFGCTFKTGYNCTFDTGGYCTFDTGDDCTFKTGSSCTFDTSYDCTFNTGSNCTFNTSTKCVVIRRDIYEIIELEEGKPIKLNGYQEKGFTYLEEEVETIEIDGIKYNKKEIEERLKDVKPLA